MLTTSLANIFRVPELRKRLLFTVGMLAVYRLGVFVSTPGVDRLAMRKVVASQGGLLGLFNLFSGGALEQLSIFALGIMPYVSASIILQLLTVVVPALEKMQKEGDVGRKRITQYTRYGTVVLAAIQGIGIATYLESLRDPSGLAVVTTPGWSFRIITVITLSAGTAFIMWMGEQITERGVGNGISLIIFAGIVARMPDAMFQLYASYRSPGAGMDELRLVILVAVMVAVVAFIVFVERAQRRIPVQYAKRVVGRRTYGGQSTHLPLRVNTGGVIPIIFAASIITIPSTVARLIHLPFFAALERQFGMGMPLYNLLYVASIIFFTYFYVSVTFNPEERADEMKKFGGFIPGIRPGKPTADYLSYVLNRITLPGSIYLGVIAVLPNLFLQIGNSGSVQNLPFGGAAVLILIGVGLDTVKQIESQLMQRNYEGFLK